ncbi:glycosyltransferase family 34 protein [Lentithecium fluviatile CBS 122367]|uniref:Glycosyltransferase family 34 protein n=1 Tax=Lentithecium fluviatile CBS 122367 TaxID=1168545 RepID=A0A6G1ITW0_9PLEO|nr:glycosyltransferase family 34 protein [Lentithecium fluviatile CBS 122367]
MHLAGRMGAERHSHLGQRLPTHQTHANQRRHPSAGRLIKYCFLAIFLFFAIGLLHGKHLSPSVVKYLPIPVDGTIGVIQETGAPVAELQTNNPFETPNAEVEEEREPPVSDESNPEYNLPNVQQNSATSPYPKFGKCTASFGEPDPPYENAIASHNLHNELHGYPHYILREHMIRGLWSKHGWIMTIIGKELAKPEDQRLKWLMWHDRDTVLMNPQIPLDVFVPPEPQFSHIHMLVTNDRHGLNNGVFMVRVNQWAFKLFASALSIREYQPEIPLKYTEQSGMEEAIKRPWWAKSVAYVPQRWFNGFPPDEDVMHDHTLAHSRQGSLLIHFASNRDGLRPERMAHWGEVAKNRTVEWDRPVEETGYLDEVAMYWDKVGKGEPFEKINREIGHRGWERYQAKEGKKVEKPKAKGKKEK